MAVVMKVVVPDMTVEGYDAVMEALGWETTEKPAGFISHVAGQGPDGWTVIDVWESEADFQQFADSRLGAALAQATGGEPPQIEPTFFPSTTWIWSRLGSRAARQNGRRSVDGRRPGGERCLTPCVAHR